MDLSVPEAAETRLRDFFHLAKLVDKRRTEYNRAVVIRLSIIGGKS